MNFPGKSLPPRSQVREALHLVANVVSRLTRVARLSNFAGLKALGLTYLPYVLGF